MCSYVCDFEFTVWISFSAGFRHLTPSIYFSPCECVIAGSFCTSANLLLYSASFYVDAWFNRIDNKVVVCTSASSNINISYQFHAAQFRMLCACLSITFSTELNNLLMKGDFLLTSHASPHAHKHALQHSSLSSIRVLFGERFSFNIYVCTNIVRMRQLPIRQCLFMMFVEQFCWASQWLEIKCFPSTLKHDYKAYAKLFEMVH